MSGEDLLDKRQTGFFFSITHGREKANDDTVRFILGASCGRCGHVVNFDDKLEKIVPAMIYHSVACSEAA